MIPLTWRESPQLTALAEMGNVEKGGYLAGHRFGLQAFPAGTYPSCTRHGAMVRVTADRDWWRCVEPGCNIGCEWHRPTEEWRPVVGWEGRFSVSSFGRVRSEKYHRLMGLAPRGDAPWTYLSVTFYVPKGQTKQSPMVHVLVAAAFLGPKPIGMEINHIDGNRMNNRVENLEYVTPQENNEHAVRLMLKAWGERHGMVKLTEEQVREIRGLRGKVTRVKIAERYGIHTSTVQAILSGKTWRHLS